MSSAKIPSLLPRPRVGGNSRKYPWDLLKSQGWFFVPIERGHSSQPCSIRASGRGQGLRVSARLAENGGSVGYLVTLAK
jgi:hypothetical protein